MFVVGNMFEALAQLVNGVLEIYSWLIIIRVLMSWVNPDPYNPIVQFLIKVTEPVLGPARRLIPAIGPVDISPIVTLLILKALQRFLVLTLMELALRLR
jgi:YggT family protein